MRLEVILCVAITTTLVYSLELRSELAGPDFSFPNILNVFSSSACFDGVDSIYVFGSGWDSASLSPQNIYKYTLSSDTLKIVGHLPHPASDGSCVLDTEGNFYYVLARYKGDRSRKSFKYFPNNQTIEVIGNYPEELNGREPEVSKVIQIGPSRAVIFRPPNTVLKWDINNMTFETMPDLPISIPTYNWHVTGQYNGKNHIFLFGRVNSSTSNSFVMKYSTITGESDFLSEEENIEFPGDFLTSFRVGSSAYIVPGDNLRSSLKETLIKYDFNVGVERVKYVGIEDYPFPGSQFNTRISFTTAVYVESLNRVYFFGGAESGINNNFYFSLKIFYIDFDPSERPSTTTVSTSTTPGPGLSSCDGKNDGIYPHPTECDWYIGCRNDSIYTFICESPFLFDPLKLVCITPSTVECGVQCFDKEDGAYPHPLDCIRYVVCHAHQAQVLHCPPPLLFDPVNRSCNFEDLVECPLINS